MAQGSGAVRTRVLLRGLARLSTMPIHVALNHVTAYRYDREVMLGPQVVRLRPAAH
jgi:Bacterial transglutaminase-like N-terminal region